MKKKYISDSTKTTTREKKVAFFIIQSKHLGFKRGPPTFELMQFDSASTTSEM